MAHGFPGAGKTTLTEALASALPGPVDLIPEPAIFTRPEFDEVGRGFKTKQFPTTDMMLAAYRRVVANALGVIVFDWSCVAMIEDLPYAQFDRTTVTSDLLHVRADPEVLVAHARAVRDVAAHLRPILIALDVPAEIAVARVAAQRGQAWLERFEPDVACSFELWRLRQDDILEAHRAAGWEVVVLDASQPADDVLHAALAALLAA